MNTRHYSPARVRSASFDEVANTIDVIWSTGSDVTRQEWDGTEYVERLLMGSSNVRLGRLNGGAPLLDTHNSEALSNVIGSVVAGSAKIENGRGLATVKLSTAACDVDSVQKIREGVIKNISVGYLVHASTRTDGDPPVVTVTDWEPLEVSAVPINADAGAQFRSATGRCTKRRSRTQAAAAYAARLLQPTQSRAEARGATEARKTVGRKTGDAEKRGAREARRLLKGRR